MSSTLRINTKETESLIKVLKAVPKAMEKASTRAINRTLSSTRTEMVKLVRKELNVKAKDVRENLEISKATWGNLEGKITGYRYGGIPLIRFVQGSKKAPSTRRLKSSGAYRPKIGIPVKVFHGRGKQPAKGVFLARMRSGHVGAFQRLRPARRASSGKQAIEEKYGPSAMKTLSSEKMDKKIGKVTDQLMKKNLKHEVEREFKKTGLRS